MNYEYKYKFMTLLGVASLLAKKSAKKKKKI